MAQGSKDFLRCVQKGGEIKTRTYPGDLYQRFCYLDGQEFKGPVKKKKQ